MASVTGRMAATTAAAALAAFTVVLVVRVLLPVPAGPPVTQTSPQTGNTVPQSAAKTELETPQATYSGFVRRMRSQASGLGIAASVIDRAFAEPEPDPEVIELLANQPENVKTAGEYVGALVSDARIEAGRQKLAELAPLLTAIEASFGVDRHILLAIWGIESNFGSAMGSHAVVRSLATLAAFDARRADFWRTELLAVLRIMQSGEVDAGNLVGSWAGAMGHTQFMPSTYAAHAVDFDHDGRRDIWSSVPDALASTASYLRASGWSAGATWGFEVRLPQGFDYGLAAPGIAMTWAEWQALGVVEAQSRGLPGATPDLQLFLPAGMQGPAWLTTGNFQAILRYNNSTSYALAVGHLADRIAGAAPIAASWPADERGLTQAERRELQRRLTDLGFDAGVADGIIGNGSRAAIRLFQKVRGLPQDGHADLALLQRLRQEGG